MLVCFKKNEILDLDIDELLAIVNKHKLLVLRGFAQVDKELFVKFCQKFSNYKFL